MRWLRWLFKRGVSGLRFRVHTLCHGHEANAQNMSVNSIRLAFVGAVVNESSMSQYPAFSRAGNLFQQRLLRALEQNGMIPSAIYSLRPVPSFPQMRKLFFFPEKGTLESGRPIYFFPFVNFRFLKTLTAGIAVFFCILAWGWRERRTSHKVIFIYNVSAPHGIFVRLAAFFIRAKVFALIADLLVPGAGVLPGTMLRWLDFWLQTRSLKLFHGLIVLSRAVIFDFASQVPFLHVEGGVPQELLQSLSEQSQRDESPDRYCTLMYAGKLDEINGGIPLLLEAFSLLDGDHYRLWIAGTGPLQKQVEQAVAKDNRIIYWGFLPYQEILSLYNKAAILINPRSTKSLSTRYVFPSKLVEYIATGKPVITTCTADVEEEYGHLVFLLRDETPKGLVDLIERIAKMPHSEKSEFSITARKYILENKTWESQGQRIVAFIQQQVCSNI